MSFPSANIFLAQGMTPEDALLNAFRTDTPVGFSTIESVVALARNPAGISAAPHDIPFCLRGEQRGEGVVVDINPNSIAGGQVMRLLGTDVARAVLSRHFGVYFGLANCCKILASCRNPADCTFSAAEQIDWQSKPDC